MLAAMSRLSLALLVGLLVAGCDAADPLQPRSGAADEDAERDPTALSTPTAERVPLLPLEVGRAWVFEYSRIRPDGSIAETGTDTVRVVADTLIAGETWHRLAVSVASDAARACLAGYYTTRDGDVWYWPDPSGAPAYRQYLYPAAAGASYPYAKPDAVAIATVVATDAPLAVPAGTFDSYWYDIDYDALAGYPVAAATPPVPRYLAPGVGFVRFESASYSPNADGEFGVYSFLRWDLLEVIAP
jgi:hypothetical protein